MKVIRYGVIFSIIILSSIVVPPVYSQISRIHEVNVSEEIFSINIPIIGELRINMEYLINFEIRKPNSIEAGNSGTITIIPKTGTLHASTYLDNSFLGTTSTSVNLGDRMAMPLASVFGVDIHVVASPTSKIKSNVNGPAIISPSIQNINSAGPVDFKIHVQENIGNSNNIQITFPVTLYVSATGGIGLIIDNFELKPRLIPFTTQTLTETISIHKNYNTYLSLQVSDGSNANNIKIYPKLTYENGNLLKYVSIYVDGIYKDSIKSNQWSEVQNIGSGSHNIQVNFLESKSPNNDAITFLESQSAVKKFTTKSYSTSTLSLPSGDYNYENIQSSNSKSSFSSGLLILIIIVIIGGGGTTAGIIIVKKKRKKLSSNNLKNQNNTKSEPISNKQDILHKFASGDISKDEYLKHVGYEQKDTLPKKSDKSIQNFKDYEKEYLQREKQKKDKKDIKKSKKSKVDTKKE